MRYHVAPVVSRSYEGIGWINEEDILARNTTKG
jgi:hypothetical protein